LLPQSSLAFRQSRGVLFRRATKMAFGFGPKFAARMANRRLILRIRLLRTSAPALGAQYFILRTLSSTLVSIVFNKLRNLLLVQS
jgi:hypothetical protein